MTNVNKMLTQQEKALARRHREQEKRDLEIYRQQREADLVKSLKRNPMVSILQDFTKPKELKLAETLLKSSKKLIKWTQERNDRTKFKRLISRIVEYQTDWIRSPYEWKPQIHSIERQIDGLLQWTFAKYLVPSFLTESWLVENGQFISWYLAVARGESLKYQPNFPNMTAKMRHLFLMTPQSHTIMQAVFRSPVLAFGGSRLLLNAVMGSSLVREQRHREFDFWITLIRFFTNNPMLAPTQFDPLYDYIKEIRRRTPTFKLAGRSPLRLIADMEQWHLQLAASRVRKASSTAWPSCGIPTFEYIEGVHNIKIWQIQEICTLKNLMEEGKILHHCVASFSGMCIKQYYSIWSLTCNGEHKLTIQLILSNYSLGQIRGLQNRMPTPRENQIISIWASQNKLTLP